MLNGLSRSFAHYNVGWWHSQAPSQVHSLLLALRGHPRLLGTANSFKRSLSAKAKQGHTFEAHLNARKEYVNALGARFVPDMPAREVHALSRRIAGLLHPVVRKVPNSPCPNLATLKLDQALTDGQWFRTGLVAAKRDRVGVTLRIILPRRSLTTSPLYIPRSISEGADYIWLCPYFDPETLTLRFRKASGDDSTVTVPLIQLFMSECGRSLAELAYSEGLIPSATNIPQTQIVDEAGPQFQEGSKVSEGISQHHESEPGFRHWRHRPNTIKTLRRSEVLAQQQVLCFDRTLTRTMGQVIVEEKQAGQVRFSFPRRLLPKDGSVFYCCPYFDQELEELRYCTLDGEDIPGVSESIMTMARSEDLLPVLLLAKAERMIYKIPDGYAKTLRLDKALASGYVIELQLPTETVADVILSLYLGPQLRAVPFKSKAMPDPDRTQVQLVPYIHASGNLRLWDKKRSQDWEFGPGEVFERSPHAVKVISPLLFDLGVREGLWGVGASGRRGKKRDQLERLANLLDLARELFDSGYSSNSKKD